MAALDLAIARRVAELAGTRDMPAGELAKICRVFKADLRSRLAGETSFTLDEIEGVLVVLCGGDPASLLKYASKTRTSKRVWIKRQKIRGILGEAWQMGYQKGRADGRGDSAS